MAWTLVLFVPFAVLARRSDDLGAVFLAPGAWLTALGPSTFPSSGDFYSRAYGISCLVWPVGLLLGVLGAEGLWRRIRIRT